MIMTGVRDFHDWAAGQATLLRSGAASGLDAERLADTLDRIIRDDTAAARSLIRRILKAAVVCEYGSPARYHEALAEMVAAHNLLAGIMTPSLSWRLSTEMANIYAGAARWAQEWGSDIGEDLSRVPSECPFSWNEVFGGGVRLPV